MGQGSDITINSLSGSIIVGAGSTVSHNNAIVLGNGASSAASQLVLGSATNQLSTFSGALLSSVSAFGFLSVRINGVNLKIPYTL